MCGKTKKIILLAIIIAALQLLIFSGTSFSLSVTDSNSKHNLSITGPYFTFSTGVPDEDEVCVYCHTPHGAIVDDGSGNKLPLWNRSISGLAAQTFNVYASSTLNAAPDSQLKGMTLLCMSCHDGVSALNVVQNFRGASPFTFTDLGGGDQIEDVWNPSMPGYPGANIGESAAKDLSNDHPVSFVFDSTLRTADGGVGLNDPTTIAPLRLFNGRLECATCHNPHDQGDELLGTDPFLRMTNLNSDMCLKCHNK